MEIEKVVETLVKNQEGTSLALGAVAESLSTFNSYLGKMVKKDEDAEKDEEEKKKKAEMFDEFKKQLTLKDIPESIAKQIRETGATLEKDPVKQQEMLVGGDDGKRGDGKEGEKNVVDEDKLGAGSDLKKRMDTIESSLSKITKALETNLTKEGFAKESQASVAGGNLGLSNTMIQKDAQADLGDQLVKMSFRQLTELEEKVRAGQVTLG